MGWWAGGEIRIRDSRDSNVSGAVVVVTWTVTNPSGGATGTATCTTGSSGRCTLRIPPTGTNLPASARQVTISFTTINGLAPPVGTGTLVQDSP